jgi:hypothetical protein
MLSHVIKRTDEYTTNYILTSYHLSCPKSNTGPSSQITPLRAAHVSHCAMPAHGIGALTSTCAGQVNLPVRRAEQTQLAIVPVAGQNHEIGSSAYQRAQGVGFQGVLEFDAGR